MSLDFVRLDFVRLDFVRLDFVILDFVRLDFACGHHLIIKLFLAIKYYFCFIKRINFFIISIFYADLTNKQNEINKTLEGMKLIKFIWFIIEIILNIDNIFISILIKKGFHCIYFVFSVKYEKNKISVKSLCPHLWSYSGLRKSMVE